MANTNYRPKLSRPEPGEDSFEEPPGVRPQPRDIKILDLVYTHRLLSSKQVYALVEGSNHRLKERLRLLWLNHYLERPPDQKVLRVRGVFRHLVYSLGPKGAEILAAEKGYNTRQLDWVARSEVKFPFIQHNLFVSQIFTCLKLALEEKEGAKLADWRQGSEIEDRIKRTNYIYKRESRADKPLIQPDALFCIYFPDKDRRSFFFLEADRGTMREKTMLGKYKKYSAYWSQRGHRNQGIPSGLGFRVITVTKNKARARNLILMLEREMDPQYRSENDKKEWLESPETFWFAAERWSIDEPDSILRRCFQAPDKSKRYSLIG